MKPIDHEIIWIKGVNGNEGKTWFQNYVQWNKNVVYYIKFNQYH